jgi:hypothetical protein
VINHNFEDEVEGGGGLDDDGCCGEADEEEMEGDSSEDEENSSGVECQNAIETGWNDGLGRIQ